MKTLRFLLLISLVAIMAASCNQKKKSQEKETSQLNDEPSPTNNKEAQIVSARSLGLAYLEENNLEEAEKQFKVLIELAPEDASGYANLGVVYLRQGDNDAAENVLEKAISLAPEDPDIRLNLAKVYELKDKEAAALEELKKSEEIAPDHVKTLYSIAEKYEGNQDAESVGEWENYMRKIVENAPRNIVARLYLVEALARENKADDCLKNLEEMEQIFPQFPEESIQYFAQAKELLSANQGKEAVTPILIFHNFLKLTPEYQGGIRELKGTQSATVGVPVISLSQSGSAGLMEGESILDLMKFTDATFGAGLDLVELNKLDTSDDYRANLAVADMDGDGDQDLFYSAFSESTNESVTFLMQSDFGRFTDITEASGIEHRDKDTHSRFVDYDNDGFLDLFVCNQTQNQLYRNVSLGKFDNLTKEAGLQGSGLKSLFVDVDHEGDLDIVIGRNGQNSLFRNNGDGKFLELGNETGISEDAYDTRGIAFGDFDNDGDIDLLVINKDEKVQLFSNLRLGKFVDMTAESGLDIVQGGSCADVGDINNDGNLDIIVASGQNISLMQNQGGGVFQVSEALPELAEMNGRIQYADITIFDFDNDGFSDILLTGEPQNEAKQSMILLHNTLDGFSDVSYLLPDEVGAVRQVALADYNQDGDQDIFLIEKSGAIKLLRNDGGNANRHLKVKLVGLRTGSGKNNYYGIGATVEVRAGELYQKKTITEPGLHFGLGQREKADVVRILWTNGVPQNIFSPGSDQDLIEEQELKGSCPFLYTWNGDEFVFLKDMMWRSALGMPMGIMGGKQTYAFPDASVEHLKIPGDLLKEHNGSYTIQVTEELWETIYADEIKLIAVDHPEETEIYVDEKFVAPPYPELRVFSVNDHCMPVSAIDEKGNNLLPMIKAKDNQYISYFQRGKFQGLTELKSVILDLGEVKDSENLYLFLNGWIFPTDASINVAISQSDAIKIKPPSLEVINEFGDWIEVVNNIGFPSGKNKTVIVDLSDKFLSNNRKVRIKTNMEIYWDYIFFAKDEKADLNFAEMSPFSAHHHFRGFSEKSRKGGRYGPHWFDYYNVDASSKWRDLTGIYTRYGDVTELLMQADNRYIIANAGEETTIRFDASVLPEVKEGWKRDFLIYSVGWVKDGDLNTAQGQTVEPMPFHGMKSYPYSSDEKYPEDDRLLEYMESYNNRIISSESFNVKLKSNVE